VLSQNFKHSNKTQKYHLMGVEEGHSFDVMMLFVEVVEAATTASGEMALADIGDTA